MTPTCPHCGASQSVAGDPFCGVCREALDEPPIPQAIHPLLQDPARLAEGQARSKKILGTVVFAAGGLITLASHAYAAQYGGTYFIAFGVMAYGVFEFVRGLELDRRARQLRADAEKDWTKKA